MIRVLIVDDDADLRDSLCTSLNNRGFSAEQAESGPVAEKMVTANPYDMVLLDLIMPLQDGIETLSNLKKIRPHLKVIMLTAFATIDNAVFAIKKGAHDYISKPFQLDNLILTIHRVREEARFEEEVRIGDLDQTLVALSNPTRRKVVELLSSGEPKRLVELAQQLKINDRSKVLFHLKSLKEAEIIDQNRSRAYQLTPTGKNLLTGLKELRKHLASS
ncbi:MAG: response regulator [Magnetococcales bacterium]|nr:response regulator [Magnetococcales bacterium]